MHSSQVCFKCSLPHTHWAGGMAIIIVAALAGGACGGVFSMSVQKGGFFVQTAGDVAPAIDRYDAGIGLTTYGFDQVELAELSFGGLAAPIPLSFIVNNPGIGEMWAAGVRVGTQAALDAAIPFSAATFDISGGALGPASAPIDLSTHFYPTTIPQFDQATFEGLQGMDPSKDFLLSFNGFVPSPASNAAVTGILYTKPDGTGGGILAKTPTATQILIPAGTLLPDTEYNLLLAYQQYIQGFVITPGPFAGALRVYEGFHGTGMRFITMSTSGADFSGDGDVDDADLVILQACATGPGVPYDPVKLPPSCTLTPDNTGRIGADFDDDRDVDQVDFGLFQRCFSGEGKPADPSCQT